jgi:3D (Asp-Asp-Asp) domain-containing protein
MKNRQSQPIFFALLCATQISVNMFGMDPTSSFTKVSSFAKIVSQGSPASADKSEDRSLEELPSRRLQLSTSLKLQRTGWRAGQRIENEQLTLLPEIQGAIVTNILDLYVNELEDAIDCHRKNVSHLLLHDNRRSLLYKKDTNKIFDKILYWIHRTRFNPLQ